MAPLFPNVFNTEYSINTIHMCVEGVDEERERERMREECGEKKRV